MTAQIGMGPESRCVDDEVIIDFLADRLSVSARVAIEVHADDCARCRTLLAECVRAERNLAALQSGADEPPAGEPLAPGAHLGRYLILDVLGHGGMTTVYRAYDPELQRAIALKVVDAPGDDGRECLQREADTLARFEHRNVVHVFDVGLHGRGVLVAMELLTGANLRDWAVAARPAPPRLLAVLIGVGRGLAAAHRANLIHRDVKPANVIVGDGDHPTLIDLGLARTALSTAAMRVDDRSRIIDRSDPRDTRSDHGVVLDTLAYLAPEQYEGAAITKATDQFSFCVMTYELLFQQRPFAGTTLAELRASVLSAAVRPPPRRRDIGRRVRKALLRGLARHPVARFPSMDALLVELAPPRRRGRRALAIATAAVLAAGGAGAAAVLLTRTEPSAAASPCEPTGTELATIWDADRRDALTAAFTSSGVARARDAAPRAVAALDGYAARWLDGDHAACTARHLAPAPSEALLARRTACLDRRRRALVALVDELVAHPTAAAIDSAVVAVEDLPELEACADPAALLAGDAIATAEPAQLAELDRIAALSSTGNRAAARAALQSLIALAAQTGERAIEAAARYRWGELTLLDGDATAAAAELEHTVALAAELADDDLAARAWIALVSARAADPQNLEPATLALAAETALRRAGSPWRLQARLAFNLGNLATAQQAFVEARDQYQRALALHEQHGDSEPRLAELRAARDAAAAAADKAAVDKAAADKAAADTAAATATAPPPDL